MEDEGEHKGEEEQNMVAYRTTIQATDIMVYRAPCASHFYLEAELTFQLNNSRKHLLPHGVVLQINQQLLRKRNGVLQFQGRLFFKKINVDLWEISLR